MLSTRTLLFDGKHGVRLDPHAIPAPSPGEVTVRTRCSGISAGTELLYYRGDVPAGLEETVDALSGPPRYPMPYGYCTVGEVEAAGDPAGESWVGRRVFAFHAHTERFTAPMEQLILLPDSLGDEEAVFLPNMETAVGMLHDAAPLLGERVLVSGLGVVGLLTGALLGPHIRAIGIDPYTLRRQHAEALGFYRTLTPEQAQDEGVVQALMGDEHALGADLTIEVSGNPSALDQAIALTGYAGRIVVGSWYGSKSVELGLGGRFHRAKQTITSSQVSAIHPRLLGRWTPRRRIDVVLDALHRIRPSRLITHRFPLESAAEAYDMLSTDPGQAIQVIFTGPPGAVPY